MFSLRLQNFRSFLDTDYIKIRPITIFVGMNSSGKSSVARMLPLLRQSVEVNSNTPILWYGSRIDFGSINEVISKISDRNDIELELAIPAKILPKFGLNQRRGMIFSRQRTFNRVGIRNIRIHLVLKNVSERSILSKFSMFLDKDEVCFEFSDDGNVTSFLVNGIDAVSFVNVDGINVSTNSLVPDVSYERIYISKTDDEGETYAIISNAVRERIVDLLRNNMHGRFTRENIRELSYELHFSRKGMFVDNLRKVGRNYSTWRSFSEDKKSDATIQLLRNLYFILAIPDIFSDFGRAIGDLCREFHYIGPARATGERFYRIQELAVDEIDPRGENLAMFLHSLSYLEKMEFSRWCSENLGYEVQTKMTGGHASIELKEVGGKLYYNIADVGYGMSQILPFYAQMWVVKNNIVGNGNFQLLVAEQPELHLHPSFQSKISDAIVSVIEESEKSSVQNFIVSQKSPYFLIETHSRQLINRLGKLIEDGRILKDNVAIYIFERNDVDSDTKIREAHFKESGQLVNWPYGFFTA